MNFPARPPFSNRAIAPNKPQEQSLTPKSHSVTGRTNGLWSSIPSLLAPSAVQAQAYEELTHIFREAFRIGFLMLSQPAHYDIEYPTARPVTWFDARYVTLSPLHYAFTPLRYLSLRPLLPPSVHCNTHCVHAFALRHCDAQHPPSPPIHFPPTTNFHRHMHNRDPAVHDPPARIQRHGRKIKLAVTPCITVIDLLARGLVRERVVLSGVLLEG